VSEALAGVFAFMKLFFNREINIELLIELNFLDSYFEEIVMSYSHQS
jgi:hypothetical protein